MGAKLATLVAMAAGDNNVEEERDACEEMDGAVDSETAAG